MLPIIPLFIPSLPFLTSYTAPQLLSWPYLSLWIGSEVAFVPFLHALVDHAEFSAPLVAFLDPSLELLLAVDVHEGVVVDVGSDAPVDQGRYEEGHG